MARLAASGSDDEDSIKPLRSLGAKSIHVSIFVSVDYPDAKIINFLKGYGTLLSEKPRRFFYHEHGFTHEERGIRVAEFKVLDHDFPRSHYKRVRSPLMHGPAAVTCYRCASTEHLVNSCLLRWRSSAWLSCVETRTNSAKVARHGNPRTFFLRPGVGDRNLLRFKDIQPQKQETLAEDTPS